MINNINIEKIKFTNMSVDDLILSLDRLTRFKHPETKYCRVFYDIICKHLLSPKLSKSNLEKTDYVTIKQISQKIWNESVNTISKKEQEKLEKNKYINNLLKTEAENCYNLTSECKKLIDTQLSIEELLTHIKKLENQPINLKRLLYTSEKQNPILVREKHSTRFPLEKIVLCEGITEEILLPCFSKLYGYEFDKKGVRLVSAGGKNQVAKLYLKFKEELKIPVFILLDADATEIAEIIKPNLRKSDKIYLIKHGEFEDIFSLNLIKRTINKRFKNICECTIADFHKSEPMTKVLTEFYRTHELGDFQKADFAKEISQNLKYKTDLSEEMIEIIEHIKSI